ncbi:rCG25324 [Rattus norvegicus]|uniref:RCG25324 n=2 Tax=Rattus norvegicus TaxID=10116 RepID=A6I3S3_RAT|nr:rCG25324 [Rattus norvegicus]
MLPTSNTQLTCRESWYTWLFSNRHLTRTFMIPRRDKLLTPRSFASRKMALGGLHRWVSSLFWDAKSRTETSSDIHLP